MHAIRCDPLPHWLLAINIERCAGGPMASRRGLSPRCRCGRSWVQLLRLLLERIQPSWQANTLNPFNGEDSEFERPFFVYL